MSPEGSSFIPKSGVKAVQRNRSTRRIYVLAYISYIVFFSTLFAVIGVYIYGVTVDRSLTSLREQLVTERQRFSVEDIESVRQLDNRLSTAKQLLDQSSAPSRIFSDIESIVASNIYFSGMTYERLPNNRFQIQLTGRANSFTDIIGQREFLGNSALLREATVVDYDYSVGGESGETSALGAATLTFIFSDTRDLSAIAYTPDVGSFNESQSQQPEATTTTESATSTEASAATTDDSQPVEVTDEVDTSTSTVNETPN